MLSGTSGVRPSTHSGLNTVHVSPGSSVGVWLRAIQAIATDKSGISTAVDLADDGPAHCQAEGAVPVPAMDVPARAVPAAVAALFT